MHAQIAAMHDVSATETVVIYGMEPLWGACFAWFVLGERWGVAGWIGAALILGKYACLLIYTNACIHKYVKTGLQVGV